ncbi:MAG: hypothetical protein ACQETH_13380 [Candidatus Rifleibacteriota bacterium]
MSSFKISLWIMICMLITATFCQAAEVAMVTDGKASAMLDDQIWSVELAEILPENVKLTVGSKQHLGLIHLINNKEYQIPADSQITLLEEGIQGIADDGKKLELVMNDSDLGDDMDDQTGAASLGRVFNPKTTSRLRKSARPSSPQQSQSEPVVEKHEVQASEQFSPRQDLEQDTLKESLIEMKETKLQRKSVMPADFMVFAMPPELAQATELKGMQKLGDANLEIFKTEQQNNWNIFYVKQLEPKRLDYQVSLDSLEDLAPMSLVYLNPARINLANAIKLEKYKLYYQAAGAWFELANNKKISPRVLKQHLSRLSQLINKN